MTDGGRERHGPGKKSVSDREDGELSRTAQGVPVWEEVTGPACWLLAVEFDRGGVVARRVPQLSDVGSAVTKDCLSSGEHSMCSCVKRCCEDGGAAMIGCPVCHVRCREGGGVFLGLATLVAAGVEVVGGGGRVRNQAKGMGL